jgi:2-polyprenyl-3-methyl-5-hydroxy-6-metoxy-1,4-benzoquinol methylase
MPGYATRQHLVRIGDNDFKIRALSDRQQFSDPGGLAQRAGISSAQWCLFGQLWPAGRILAEAMHHYDVEGKRILEIGCGLGLSSLVLQKRQADITGSDHHPLAETFLLHNAKLNALPSIRYRDLPWNHANAELGRFDMIIGSDVLYERDHAALLSSLLLRHARPETEIVFTDPGRGNSGAFTRELKKQGYDVNENRGPSETEEIPPYKLRLLSYRR